MQIFAPDFFRLTYFRRLKMQLSCISNRFIFIFLASAKIRKILFSVRRFLGPRNFVFYGFADKHFMTITLSFQALPGPWVCSGKQRSGGLLFSTSEGFLKSSYDPASYQLRLSALYTRFVTPFIILLISIFCTVLQNKGIFSQNNEISLKFYEFQAFY